LEGRLPSGTRSLLQQSERLGEPAPGRLSRPPGAHVRFSVSDDGRDVVIARKRARSCLSGHQDQRLTEAQATDGASRPADALERPPPGEKSPARPQ
jgi:hypothetical protein